MLELLMGRGKISTPVPGLGDTGPGPSSLIKYYERPTDPSKKSGYFGKFSPSEFVTGDQLATLFNLSAGTNENNATTPWLKFYLDGKVLFIPQKPFRSALSWVSIYNAGLVYGDDTIGYNKAGNGTLQTAKLTFAGRTFRVRLMRGANGEGLPANQASVTDSEWNRLMYNLIPGTVGAEDPGWDVLAGGDLDNGNALRTICIEWRLASNYNFVRGFNGDVTAIASVGAGTINGGAGWRPVLELVP